MGWQGEAKPAAAVDGKDADGGADLPPPALRRSSRHHFWEDDLGEHLCSDVPQELMERCRYTGAPLARRARKPLLLATVEGMDDKGRPFQWIARRSRKRVHQPYECPTPPPPVTWLGSLSWKHHSKPGWWVAVLFGLGSILFLITGVARETRAVSYPAEWPPGLGSLAAGLSAWPECVACIVLYFPGVLLQLYEAANMDLGCRSRAWEKGGRGGARPRPRLLPTGEHLRTVSWWAVFLQLLGILGFMMGSITDVVGMAQYLPAAVFKWCQLFGFLLGGTFFTLASLLACLEETGSWWRGIVPSRCSDVHSISWMAVFFAFHGSMGFLVVGWAFFFKTFSWTSQQWLIAYGQLAASVFFIASSLAGMLEQENPWHL